ncbi:hypothetical protein [Enterococcus rivorum]|nr:hypothetical protein [Enterococcus rivorum]MBP2100018.1 hypothetical protein [Enterococcus rivorum]
MRKMEDLEKITTILTGEFDNKEQFNSLSEAEKATFPYAVHKNHIVNKKINNLPKDFNGIYLHEESYYTLKGKEKFKSDLFLFTYDNTGKVTLNAITVPKEATNCKYLDLKSLNYNDLSISVKFVPLKYVEHNGIFSGESKSMFTKSTEFILKQNISTERLIIKESLVKLSYFFI